MDEAYKVIRQISLGIIIAVAATSFILGEEFIYSRQMVAYSWAFTILGVVGGRFVYRGSIAALRAHGIAAERLLIVGAGPTGQLVLDKIRRSPQLGYDVAGFVRHRPWPDDRPRDELDDAPVLGMTDNLASIVEEYDVDEIIIAMAGVSHQEILDVILRVIELPVSIRVYPDTFRLITSDVLSISDLNGLPTVEVRTLGLRPVDRVVKRGMDLVISCAALVMLSPLMLLCALLIKLTSPGPVFFVQERVGRDGRRFNVIKFRSMPVDAEQETGPIFATRDDPRPTALGRFMRRYSIDELPQLINVLLGEMSVVGPRPERPHFVDQFRQTIPAYMARHYEKAGLTGWAQVNRLRGDSSIEERTRYDLYYVENWSILFDLKIMVKTLLHIFRNDNNAY
jgi:exopolysaccharide biosynthesis polyprenyl glycosylphosphotransferase